MKSTLIPLLLALTATTAQGHGYHDDDGERVVPPLRPEVLVPASPPQATTKPQPKKIKPAAPATAPEAAEQKPATDKSRQP